MRVNCAAWQGPRLYPARVKTTAAFGWDQQSGLCFRKIPLGRRYGEQSRGVWLEAG